MNAMVARLVRTCATKKVGSSAPRRRNCARIDVPNQTANVASTSIPPQRGLSSRACADQARSNAKRSASNTALAIAKGTICARKTKRKASFKIDPLLLEEGASPGKSVLSRATNVEPRSEHATLGSPGAQGSLRADDASDHAVERTRGVRVELSRDPSGEVREPARLDAQTHRVRHTHRILRSSDRGVEEHAVDSELHRDRDVGCRAHARIDDHRHSHRLEDDADVVRIENALARTDRRAGRHDAGRARLLEPPCEDRIVRGVDEDGEAFAHEDLRRPKRLDRIGKERALVPEDLELQKIGPERFAREPRDSHGVIRRVATGGVRKDRVARTIDHREKVLLGAREIDAANRDRDDLRARCLVTSLHDLVRGVLARADEEARAESIALHDELFIEARRRERSERAGLGHGGASPFVRQPERWAGLGVEMRPKRGESKEENDSRNREVEPRTNGLEPESFDRALTAPHERH